jgi:hypothetical protein
MRTGTRWPILLNFKGKGLQECAGSALQLLRMEQPLAASCALIRRIPAALNMTYSVLGLMFADGIIPR